MGLFSKDEDKKKKKEKETEMGFDESEAEEAEEAEEVLATDMDEEEVSLKDTDTSTAGYETYDKETGELEGKIILKDGERGGERIFVKFIEDVSVNQDHNLDDVSITFDGTFKVENPSEIDRIWDVDIELINTEKTDLGEEKIHITEIGTEEDNDSWEKQFKLEGEAKNLLLVKEYISTLPREEADNVLNPTDINNDLNNLQEKEVEQGEEEVEEEEIKEDLDEVEEEVEEEDEDEDEDEWTDGGMEAAEYNLESFAVPKDAEKTITFVIAMKNLFNAAVKNVEVVKNIPDEFTNISILDAQVGMADEDGEQITWTIDELEPDTTVILKFTADILTTDIDSVKTGLIDVTYEGASSFAEGLEVDEFDAYARNKFFVETLERDEEPGVWDCQLIFENTSDFIVQILNADVYDPEFPDDETKKMIDIDPSEIDPLPKGAQWLSRVWEYESDEYPSFKRRLEFRVMPDYQTIVNGALSIEDTELEIASLTGKVYYSLKEFTAASEEEEEEEVIEGEEAKNLITVPTFKEKDVYASLTLINDGSAPLNEVKITQDSFSEIFQAPDPESDEIHLYLDGEEMQIEGDAIVLEDNTMIFNLKDLKDSDMGMFQPDSKLELQYPIHCIKPKRDDRFVSEVELLGNTYPVSEPLVYEPDVPEIEAVHLRRKFRIGKEVIPIGELGTYRIELSVENRGNMPLSDLVLMDKVPDSFEYTNESQEPEIVDEVGQDILKWDLEPLDEGETVRITYEIIGSEDYHPSDAQMAM